jgi:hypothetical protein
VLAFANTVADYDPETAARWPDTVSYPNDRAALLEKFGKSREDR